MTAMPRELARRKPANVPAPPQTRRSKYDPPRTGDGHIIARRGGTTGAHMTWFIVLLLLGVGLAGLLLSYATPTI